MHRIRQHLDLAGHPLVARIAPHLEVPAAAVGGVVRDALLGRPHGDDLDVVVEGDAVQVARRLASALGVRVLTHPRFLTAVLDLGDAHVDLITARSERYAHPGALPEVTPGTMDQDLRRRDFTVNAMAAWITGPDAGTLLDPTGGTRDLADGVLRALRDDAFQEDPSRVVRAARYAGRLDLTIESGTRAAASTEAPRLDWGDARVAEELRRLLDEDDPRSAVGVLRALGAAGVRVDAQQAVQAIDRARATRGAPELAGWALRLGGVLDGAALPDVALPGWAVRTAHEVRDGAALAVQAAPPGPASRVDALLRAVGPAAGVGALAAGAGWVAGWWADGRDRRLDLDGGDLLDAGIPPGPAVGRGLAAARAAMLDGEAQDRDAQLAVALRAARA